MMENRLFRKGLAVGAIILFFGISVIPSVIGDNPSCKSVNCYYTNNMIKSNYNSFTSAFTYPNIIYLDELTTINCDDEGEEVVDQQQTTHCNRGQAAFSGTKLAQSFTPLLSRLTKIRLYLWREGDFDSLKISIRESLDGEDLTYMNKPAHNISDWPFPIWGEFNLSDIELIPNHTYYIIWEQIGGGYANCSFWVFNKNNPYERGDAWIYLEDEWTLFELPFYPEIDFCFETYGLNNPPSKPSIKGPSNGKINTPYQYIFNVSDPEETDVYLNIDWGDGTYYIWIGAYESSKDIIVNKTWAKPGDFTIRAVAKDIHGTPGEWETYAVSMPKNKATNTLFFSILENHPNMFPIMRHILEL